MAGLAGPRLAALAVTAWMMGRPGGVPAGPHNPLAGRRTWWLVAVSPAVFLGSA